MEKDTFLKFFFNAPGLVGERLFACFDVERQGVLTEKQFIDGLAEFARGTTQGKIQFAFNLFDLSGKGYLSRTGPVLCVRVWLSACVCVYSV